MELHDSMPDAIEVDGEKGEENVLVFIESKVQMNENLDTVRRTPCCRVLR